MWRAVLGVAIGAAALAGCGNERTRPPETQVPDPPRGTREVTLAGTGIRFTAPFNWPDLQAEGSRVGGIQNKRATVAVWRYPRSEPLPDTAAEVDEVRRLLLERVRRRDPTFRVESARARRLGGARAIEIVGRQRMAGLGYGVRSAHVFHDGTEVVLDAYAPAEHFPRVDRQVFAPLLDSLRFARR